MKEFVIRAGLGLSEQELREELEAELDRSMRVEGGLTPRSVAHSIARVLELDHRRVADQLERAGVQVGWSP